MRFAGSNPQISSFISADFSPRYDEQADAGMKGRSLERKMGHEAEGFVASSGLDAMAKVQGAHEQARGIVAQGEAQGEASRAQGMSSMMSSIAGGIGGMSFGGSGTFNYAGGPGSSGTAMGAGGGTVGGFGTLGPNYGIYQG